jgi:hypothetical protein
MGSFKSKSIQGPTPTKSCKGQVDGQALTLSSNITNNARGERRALGMTNDKAPRHACATSNLNKKGNMRTKDFARSLPPRTSRRLGSAPARLACTQRGPKRSLVLVCSGTRHIPPHSTAALHIQRVLLRSRAPWSLHRK